jgi:hypothetical protein
MVTCPLCGKTLTKESGRSHYCCENEHCPVLFVRSPTNPFKKEVVFEASVSRAIVNRIEEATAHEILVIRSTRV